MTPYKLGQVTLFAKLGAEDRSALENTIVAAAAASPFAGLIGQKKIIHDPLQGAKGEKFKNHHYLSKASRPGDVILTSKTKGSIWKNTQSPFSGTEFYHAQPVIGRDTAGTFSHGTTASAGEMQAEAGKSLKDLKGELGQVKHELRAHGYDDALLLRPKNLSKAQAKQVGGLAGLRTTTPYDGATGLRAWAKDIFLPKIDAVSNMGAQTVCKGDVCSTIPAQALQEAGAGKVVPGKRAKNVLPADFLRSDQYELVGSSLTKQTRQAAKNTSPWVQKLKPLRARAGLGLGLAGGAYAVQEEPELAGAAAGGLAATKITDRLSEARHGVEAGKQMPRLWDFTEAAIEDQGRKKGKKLLHTEVYKNFLKRRVPRVALGAGIGYAGAAALSSLLSKNESQ